MTLVLERWRSSRLILEYASIMVDAFRGVLPGLVAGVFGREVLRAVGLNPSAGAALAIGC